MSEILLVDLSAVFHQAWHSTGAEENADASSRSTVRRIRELAKTHKHVAVCLDSSPTWRHALSADYKRSRKSKPPEFRAQLERCIRDLGDDGFPLWRAENHEADDVIASACRVAVAAGHTVVIATADKDLHQPLGPSVAIHNIRDNELVDVEACRKKFGVGPDQLGDWLALQGDKSDDIVGLQGVGEVTATTLLQRHKSISRIVEVANLEAEELDDIAGLVDAKGKPARPMGPKLRDVIIAGVTTLSLARSLVTLRDNLPIALEQALAPRIEKPKTNVEEWGDMHDPEREAIQAEQPMPAPTPIRAPEPTPKAIEYAEPPPKEAPFGKVAPTSLLDTIEMGPEWSKGLEPRNMIEAERLAGHLHNSRVFSATWPNREAILAGILFGREHGIPALKVLLPGVLHSVEGKLGMSAQLIAGLIIKSPVCEFWRIVESTDEKCVIHCKRRGDEHVHVETYTAADAARAGLTGRHSKRPRTMIRHRCESEAGRAMFPDVTFGLYDESELEDMAAE